MKTVPVSSILGTELRGIDLTRPLDPAEIEAARRAYADTHLILVRGQRLTRQQYATFVGYFWDFKTDDAGEPAWTAVSNVDERDGTGRGVLLYHQDEAFLPAPCRALSLYANQASDTSAPTSFANALRAARQLDPQRRATLERLRACHLVDFECINGDSTYRVREFDLPPDAPRERFPRTVHPVLFPLGAGDERVLYVSEHQTSHILDMPVEESERLLHELFGLLYADDNVVVHHWEPCDLIVWNNIALQHGRPTKVGDGPRDFWRLKTFAPPRVELAVR